MKRTAWRAATFLVSVSVGTLAVTARLAPAWADDDRVLHTRYDGVTNDLLTAGLGKSGLGSAVPPGFVDPLHPTAEELRRLAIYNNYRALIDPTPGGGYGTLYGPNITANGTVTAGEGLIAGDEYITFDKQGDGRTRVTMMVQVPDTYDPSNGCIVTAPSSGSRGVYGAIATAGEWGLKRGCAVAYTD
ncbi:MAG: 3-hydroxybutyrate oligomer hydrolase family protein, partial [Xanthobacteraceae bacterium]